VDTDTGNDVNEILENNNFRISAAISDLAPYRATVEIESTNIVSGSPIVFWGQALRRGSDDPVPDVPVNLYLRVGDVQRVIAARTDTNGNYVATFTPLSGEAGNFTVTAMYPGQSTPRTMASATPLPSLCSA